MSGTEMRSTQRISGSEQREFGRWFELLFMLLKELLLKVLFIVPPPLTWLLLFWAKRQPSSCFNSAHVASLSLSDSGVSRDTFFGWKEKWKIDCLVDWKLVDFYDDSKLNNRESERSKDLFELQNFFSLFQFFLCQIIIDRIFWLRWRYQQGWNLNFTNFGWLRFGYLSCGFSLWD